MKKKILCLLLILALLPVGFLFVGCNKNAYSLANLEADYNKLTTNCEAVKINSIGDSKEILVDYSVYKFQDESFLKQIVENKEPYKKLNYFYNTAFNNSMCFAYEYLTDCAKDNLGVTDTLANEVETRLNNLKVTLEEVDSATTLLADTVRFSLRTDGNEMESSCISGLANLFSKYESLLEASLNFNTTLSRVYFGYAVHNSNVDYSKYSIGSANQELEFKKNTTIALAISSLKAKVKYQIVNLTQCMFELNIKASNLATSLTTEPYGNCESYNACDLFMKKVEAINKDLDSSKANIIAEDVDATNAQTMLDNLVELYNIQNSITNDSTMYSNAFDAIDYLKVKGDLINATITEKMCVDIIDNYNAIINAYQAELLQLINFVVTL